MSHIFISYSRKDQKYARALADDLRENGFDVWMDDRIDYGDRWWQTIVAAIKACGAFVIVMSPDAEHSKWVEREILVAQKANKPVFPVLLRGEEFSLLIELQFADVRDGSLPPEDFYYRLSHAIQPLERTGKFVAPKSESQSAKFLADGRWAGIGAIVGILSVIVAVIAIFVQGNNDTPTPTQNANLPTTPPVILETSPTETSSPTRTSTQTPSATFTEVNMDDVVATFDAQASQTMAVLFSQATETQNFISTQATEIAFQAATQTATFWTATPTINVTASLAAVLTQRAEDAIATDIAGQTATATLWTATSTPTIAYTETPTITRTPSLTPIPLEAYSFLEATGQIRIFADTASFSTPSLEYRGAIFVPTGTYTITGVSLENDFYRLLVTGGNIWIQNIPSNIRVLDEIETGDTITIVLIRNLSDAMAVYNEPNGQQVDSFREGVYIVIGKTSDGSFYKISTGKSEYWIRDNNSIRFLGDEAAIPILEG